MYPITATRLQHHSNCVEKYSRKKMKCTFPVCWCLCCRSKPIGFCVFVLQRGSCCICVRARPSHGHPVLQLNTQSLPHQWANCRVNTSSVMHIKDQVKPHISVYEIYISGCWSLCVNMKSRLTWVFHLTLASLWSSDEPAEDSEGPPGDRPERGPLTSAVALTQSRCRSTSAGRQCHGKIAGCTSAPEHNPRLKWTQHRTQSV